MTSSWSLSSSSAKANNPSRRLIVGGVNARQGRYPYFTTLDRYCAGALIAPDIVLTAGHCKPHSRHDVGQLHVGTFFFDYDRDAATSPTDHDDDYDKETFDVLSMIRHQEFQRKGEDEFSHDFAIFKLKGFSSQTPIRINRNTNVPSEQERQEMIAMGLGYMYDEWSDDDDNAVDDDDISSDLEQKPLRPDVLQQVTINYMPNDKCRLAADQEESYSIPPDRIDATHLCTFVPPDNKRDACAYDSGGPIIIPSNNNKNNDGDLLVALVSWGIGCADPIFPAVNARVSAVSDWIDAQVCRLSEQPPDDFGCTSASTKQHHVPKTNFFGSNPGWMMTALGFLVVLCLMGCHFKRLWFARRGKHEILAKQSQPESLSPFAMRFLGVKRADTGETASLRSNSGSDDDDLPSYHSTDHQESFRV